MGCKILIDEKESRQRRIAEKRRELVLNVLERERKKERERHTQADRKKESEAQKREKD